VREVVPDPEATSVDSTTAPAASETSNRYDSDTAIRVVEFVTTSVAGVPRGSLTALIGDCGTGTVAFSNEPSAFAFAETAVTVLGVEGLGDDWLHAAATTIAHATGGSSNDARFI
jgi:hypothetical protein